MLWPTGSETTCGQPGTLPVEVWRSFTPGPPSEGSPRRIGSQSSALGEAASPSAALRSSSKAPSSWTAAAGPARTAAESTAESRVAARTRWFREGTRIEAHLKGPPSQADTRVWRRAHECDNYRLPAGALRGAEGEARRRYSLEKRAKAKRPSIAKASASFA